MPKKPKKFYKKARPKSEEKLKDGKPDKKPGSGQTGRTSTKESPKNHRPIAERKSVLTLTKIDMVLFTLLAIVSLGGSIWIGNQAREAYVKFRKVDIERKKLQESFTQWGEIAIAHPGSRDVYLHLASISYQLKEMQNAQKFTERALEIDPNYEPALKMKEIVR